MITFIVTIMMLYNTISRKMAFSTAFDSMINDFCKTLSIKYKLDHTEVYSLWSSSPQQQSQPQSSSTEKKEDDSSLAITHETISAATKDMLAGMCKKVGLKQSGKKEELYKRLVDHLTASPKTEVVSKKPSSSSSSKKEDPPVIKSVKERTAELAIRKNSHGNFEHVATGLVFNTDKMVYGKQSEDGTVNPLTVDDIELCKKYKFPFKVPDNLNTSKNLDDVKVEEMVEEVLEDDDLEDDMVEDEEDLGEDEN